MSSGDLRIDNLEQAWKAAEARAEAAEDRARVAEASAKAACSRARSAMAEARAQAAEARDKVAAAEADRDELQRVAKLLVAEGADRLVQIVNLQAELDRLRTSIREHWRTVLKHRPGEGASTEEAEMSSYWAGRRDILRRLIHVAGIDPEELKP